VGIRGEESKMAGGHVKQMLQKNGRRKKRKTEGRAEQTRAKKGKKEGGKSRH